MNAPAGVDERPGEEWRAVVGYEGKYLISSLGRVYSIPRPGAPAGRLLTPGLNDAGYIVVRLSGVPAPSKTISARLHRLLGEAFLTGPRAGSLVRHLNDVRNDNRLENLAWGTKADNALDAVRNGLIPSAIATHCQRGHEFTPKNILRDRSGRRTCRACNRMREAARRARALSTAWAASRAYRAKCVAKAPPTPVRRFWTADEIAVVARAELTTPEAAAIVGRSFDAVANMRSKLRRAA